MTLKLAIYDLDHTLTTVDTLLLFYYELFKFKPLIILKIILKCSQIIMQIILSQSLKFVKDNLFEPLKGLTFQEIEHISNKVLLNIKRKYYRKSIIEELVKDKQNGYKTVLLSASIENYVSKIAEDLKFDTFIATRLNFNQNCFTGKFCTPNCKGIEKIKRLKEIEDFSQVNWKISKAYSDHHSDLPVLSLVGNAIAVSPTKKLLQIAKRRQWKIIKI